MKRIYVHDAVYDAVRDELVALAQTMKVGNPFDPAVSIGPVQSRGQYERLRFVSPNGRRSYPTHLCPGQSVDALADVPSAAD